MQKMTIFLIVNISMCKMILEVEYSKSMIYEKNVQKNNLFHLEMILKHLFCFNDTATTEIYTILFVGSVRCV